MKQNAILIEMKKTFLILALFVLIVVGLYFFLNDKKISTPRNQQNEKQPASESNITREEIIKDLVNKISSVSPVKPVLGGDWYITRFWFIKDNDESLYTEYEDGHIMARILLEATKIDSKLNYKVIAYFEPGETDWVLKEGEDKFFGKPLDLYEYSEESGEWIKKN